jgi:uncharacterized protein (TIGR03083 family)
MKASRSEDAMTSDSHLQPLVAAQFEALADVLVSIAPTDWDRPSLCEGWRIKEVIAHLTMPARYDQDAFMAELRAHGFDFSSLSNAIADRDGRLPTDRLVADLRSETLQRWTPPDGGSRGALNHVVVHGLDVTTALDVARPADEAVIHVLDDLTGGAVHEHFGVDLAGRRLEATDLEWSWGAGPTLRGPATALVLVLTGRRAGYERVDGAPL